MKKIFMIINLKTLVITLLSVLSTFLCITYSISADFPLTLIATAIIFPIVFSINGAYKRREVALGKIQCAESTRQSDLFRIKGLARKPFRGNTQQITDVVRQSI